MDNWKLYNHLDIAKHLSVLKPKTIRACQILREYRNFIHPGAAKRKQEKTSLGTATISLGALIKAIEDLHAYANPNP